MVDKDVRDDIEASPLLVVGIDDALRGMNRIGIVEHHVPGLGIVVPTIERLDVHWAELPLPERIFDPRVESLRLFLLADLEPDLDKADAAVDDELLDDRHEIEEPPMLFGGAEIHDVLDAGAVVPAAVYVPY